VLPRNAVLVCANSLVVSNKAESARHQYNLRVVETLGAARVLSNYLNLEVDSDGEKTKRRLVTLREVLARKGNFYRDEQDAQREDLTQLRKGLEDILKGNVLDYLLPKVEGRTGVTLDEMISMSGMDKIEFMEVYLSWVDVETTHFELYLRAKHVFEEALRVLQFRGVCLDGGDNEESKLQTLGMLMNDSHESCNKQFDCSHPKVNDLVQVARSFGEVETGWGKGRVYGSRVTGAGWGGCIVSLVHREDADAFIAHVKKRYASYEGMGEEDLAGWVFATEPGMGACVFRCTD